MQALPGLWTGGSGGREQVRAMLFCWNCPKAVLGAVDASQSHGMCTKLDLSVALTSAAGIMPSQQRQAHTSCAVPVGGSCRRYSYNIDLAPQDLSDTDLPPFEACVQVCGHIGL